MDTSFVEALENRARTMLPPATVMLLECQADKSGDEVLTALLEELQQKGLRGESLCDEPYERVAFDDRVLLRCAGCAKEGALPRLGGVGRGDTPDEARRNALFALTLSMDKPSARLPGCMAAHVWGQGDVEDIQYACIINRVAYKSL